MTWTYAASMEISMEGSQNTKNGTTNSPVRLLLEDAKEF